MRMCRYCKGELVFQSGDEDASQERLGNAVERDNFKCDGCQRIYHHIYRESFSGDRENWLMLIEGEWESVPKRKWPKIIGSHSESGYKRFMKQLFEGLEFVFYLSLILSPVLLLAYFLYWLFAGQ